MDELLPLLLPGLRRHRRFDAIVADDAAAARFFADAVHDGGCPICAATRWTPAGRHHIDCDDCGRVSLYRGTPLQRRRLRLRPLLAAIHGIVIDTATPSARGFSRAWRLRLETAWRLLHELRELLPPTPLPDVLQAFPLLGRNGDNHAGVVVGVAGGRACAFAVVVDEDDDEEEEEDAFDGDAAGDVDGVVHLWWGLLRAWLTSTFRGVSRRHLWRYLREWTARHGRVGALAEAR